MGKSDILVDLLYGDSGKGRIVDLLCENGNYTHVVRYNGGGNAGKQIEVNGNKIKLHHIPSAVFYENVIKVIGNGCVVDPVVLMGEIIDFNKHNSAKLTKDNFWIDSRVHLTTPEHISEDKEKNQKLGTTNRGIGPTYSSKINRNGLRFEDAIEKLSDDSFLIQDLGKTNFWDSVQFLYQFCRKHEFVVEELNAESVRVLLESAQGTLLDIDHGTYPYVTSSSSSAGGSFQGSGVSPRSVSDVIGVIKIYNTRVGSGPMKCELMGDEAEDLRKLGNEYGTTTKRPRRVGWLYLPELRYSIKINGCNKLILTKMDLLEDIKDYKICDAGVTYENLDKKKIIEILERELEIEIVGYSNGPERSAYKKLRAEGILTKT